VLSIGLFETWRERTIAFLLLTLIGFAGVAAAIYLYLTDVI